MVVALDSNVFIAFLEQAQDTDFFKAAAEIMRATANGTLDVVYSSIVFGEISLCVYFHLPARRKLFLAIHLLSLMYGFAINCLNDDKFSNQTNSQ